MFLTRIFAIFAPVRKSLVGRTAAAPATEECVILKRLRQLMEVTPQVSPTLPAVESAEGGVQAGDA
jgi:hypothetical protein